MKRFLLLLLFLCLTTNAIAGQAIRYAPLDGAWAPNSGTLFAIMYANHYAASKYYLDGARDKSTYRKITQNVDALRLGGFSYYSEDLRFQYSVIIPFGDARADADFGIPLPAITTIPSSSSFTSNGLGDIEINGIVSPFQWNKGTYFNGYLDLALSVTAPTGVYDHNSPINMGSNRWQIRSMVGVGQNIGPIHVDLFAGYDYYTDNDAYKYDWRTKSGVNNLNYRTMEDGTLTQMPEMWSEAHLTYFIAPETKTYASVSFGGLWGSRKEIDDHKINEQNEAYATKFTMGTTITPHISMYAYYMQELYTKTGPQGSQVGVRFGIVRIPGI